MRAVRLSVEIDAPADRVWGVLRDVARWHEWTSTVLSIRCLDGRPLELGSRVHIRQPKLLPSVWTVIAYEEGREFAWLNRHPGFTVTERHRVDGGPSGSRATLSIEFAGWLGPLVAYVTRRLNVRYLSIALAGLKRRGEQVAAGAGS